MKCNAELKIADDFHDNEATMHCQLEEGHMEEEHCEKIRPWSSTRHRTVGCR